MTINRRLSKQIYIGDVAVGGGAPISVQSMTNTDTRDVGATVAQIKRLEDRGCEIIRAAVLDQEAAEAVGRIKRQIGIPLVADIHFDYRLALTAIANGVDALRLNPGNIRRREHVQSVVKAAKERQIPIRIGVNAGSLPDIGDRTIPAAVAQKMVAAAEGHIKILEDLDFDLIKVSLKAFDVETTVEAYRLMARRSNYPLHLGITEAGTPRTGTIRSAVGLGILLYDGIGDTLRVSLTGDPVEEVFVGYEILKSLNLRQRGPVLISCPTCGRTEIDLNDLALEVERRLQSVSQPIKVAVMGCVVNGPGEAREADVGVAGGRGKGIVFREGQIVRSVRDAELLPALMEEINRWLEEHRETTG